jgi:outer membrane protein assembly factor BamB
MRPFTSLILLFGLCFSFAARGDDFADRRDHNWHQWRGPAADGVAPLGAPPITWDETTNVRWKVEIPGEGSATPIVWGDRVFTIAAIKTERDADEPPRDDDYSKTRQPLVYYQFVVTCLDRATGEILWSHVAHEAVPHQGRHISNTYASASPTTDGQRLYVSFGSQGIYCHDLDGEPLWQRDLGQMRTRYGWGEATSPVVHDGRLIVNWDHEDQSVLYVLDAASGETFWQLDRDEPTTWATPLVVMHEGRAQIVVNGTNRATGYDLDLGTVLWQCGGQTINAIPSPVAADGVVYCMSGKGAAATFAIPLSSRGDITDTDRIAWDYPHDTPYVPSPLLYDGRLYFTRSNSAIISCLDAATGRVIFGPERLPGLTSLYASPVAAAGHIYLAGREGTTLVFRAGDTLEVVAKNTLDTHIDASPAIVGGQVFLRGAGHVYCVEENEASDGR